MLRKNFDLKEKDGYSSVNLRGKDKLRDWLDKFGEMINTTPMSVFQLMTLTV